MISRLYASVDPRLWVAPKSATQEKSIPGRPTLIIPVKLCGEDAYGDSLGFVVAAELRKAMTTEDPRGNTPPSTLSNPVPQLRLIP